MDKPKVYLAGKIQEAGWRDSIATHPYFDYALGHQWDVIEGIDYAITGPFFVQCGHADGEGNFMSCASGESDHQMSFACWGNNVNLVRPHARRLCLAAIQQSDIVFAWFDDATAYGTIAEIGLASGLDKRIIIAVPVCPMKDEYVPRGHQGPFFCDCMLHGQTWFVTGLPGVEVIQAETALEAWDSFLAGLRKSRAIQGQNEVELMFWGAHTWYEFMHEACILDLEPQHEIIAGGKKYRLDFYSPSRQCAIEVDGLAYHNGQKSFIADRERQRTLEMTGIRVLRFAAKEVMEDAYSCYKQAVKWAENV